MKRIWIFLLLVAVCLPLFGQDFQGHIMDQKQRPLKGVKVWRKNTTESVITDKLGVFAFSQVLPTDTLVVQVSKKEEAIIPLKGLNNISVKLEKKFFLVHDGSKEIKSDYRKLPRITYNSNKLTYEQIQQLNANSIYDLLNGNIAGVTVGNGSSGRQVSIRGGASFESGTEPLFVVDGTQYESSADVDRVIAINDIEEIEVQKEGAAYGVRGANGVIIITLRKK